MPQPKKLLKLVEIALNCLQLHEIGLHEIAENCSKLLEIARNCTKLPELCSNYNRKLPKSQSKIANIEEKSKLPHIFIGQPPRSFD